MNRFNLWNGSDINCRIQTESEEICCNYTCRHGLSDHNSSYHNRCNWSELVVHFGWWERFCSIKGNNQRKYNYRLLQQWFSNSLFEEKHVSQEVQYHVSFFWFGLDAVADVIKSSGILSIIIPLSSLSFVSSVMMKYGS